MDYSYIFVYPVLKGSISVLVSVLIWKTSREIICMRSEALEEEEPVVKTLD